jgi:hypothetical protein
VARRNLRCVADGEVLNLALDLQIPEGFLSLSKPRKNQIQRGSIIICDSMRRYPGIEPLTRMPDSANDYPMIEIDLQAFAWSVSSRGSGQMNNRANQSSRR